MERITAVSGGVLEVLKMCGGEFDIVSQMLCIPMPWVWHGTGVQLEVIGGTLSSIKFVTNKSKD
jgi:hypothetical protein